MPPLTPSDSPFPLPSQDPGAFEAALRHSAAGSLRAAAYCALDLRPLSDPDLHTIARVALHSDRARYLAILTADDPAQGGALTAYAFATLALADRLQSSPVVPGEFAGLLASLAAATPPVPQVESPELHAFRVLYTALAAAQALLFGVYR